MVPTSRYVDRSVRCFGLAVDLVGDDQGIVADTGGAFVDAFQKVLEHHRARGISGLIAGALPDHVHGACDHPDVLRGHGFHDIVEHADPCPDRHSTPSATGVEDLMAMKLNIIDKPVSRSSRRGHAIKFGRQRDRCRSVEEESCHSEPVIGVRLVYVRQQHPSRIVPWRIGVGAPPSTRCWTAERDRVERSTPDWTSQGHVTNGGDYCSACRTGLASTNNLDSSIRIACAVAESGSVVFDGDASADDEVDGFHFVDVDGGGGGRRRRWWLPRRMARPVRWG